MWMKVNGTSSTTKTGITGTYVGEVMSLQIACHLSANVYRVQNC